MNNPRRAGPPIERGDADRAAIGEDCQEHCGGSGSSRPERPAAIFIWRRSARSAAVQVTSGSAESFPEIVPEIGRVRQT